MNTSTGTTGGDRGSIGITEAVATTMCSPSAVRYARQPHINGAASLQHQKWIGSTTMSNGIPTTMHQGEMVPNNSASAALFAQLQQQHLPPMHPGMYMHSLAMQGALHLGAGMLLPPYGFAAPQHSMPTTTSVVSTGSGIEVSKCETPAIMPVPQVVSYLAGAPATPGNSTNSTSATAQAATLSPSSETTAQSTASQAIPQSQASQTQLLSSQTGTQLSSPQTQPQSSQGTTQVPSSPAEVVPGGSNLVSVPAIAPSTTVSNGCSQFNMYNYRLNAA